jgi:hypothetical protein
MTDSDSTQRGEGWSAWLDAGREALKAELAAARAGVTLARTVLKGDLDAAQASRTYVQALQREGERYWRTASTLGAAYARDLARLGVQVAEELLDDVRSVPTRTGGRDSGGTPTATGEQAARFSETSRPHSAGAPAGDEAASAVDEPVRAVELRGALGSRTTDSFTVTNRRTRPRRIEVATGPLRDGQGAAIAGVQLEVAPAQVTLRPGEQAVIVVEVELNRDVLVEGGIYHGEITVTGGEEATIEATVTVE